MKKKITWVKMGTTRIKNPIIKEKSEVNSELIEKAKNHYVEFIETNMKVLLKFLRPEWVDPSIIKYTEVKGVAIDDLKNKKENPEYETLLIGDQFVNSEYVGNFNIAKDILKRGTFWYFILRELNGEYFVDEGKHRLASIQLSIQEGIWPKDKKIFCLIYNGEDPRFDINNIENQLEKKYQMKRFRWWGSRGEIEFFDEGVTKLREAMIVMAGSCSNFRNFFWDSDLAITPYEGFNNYEKYKNYWGELRSKLVK